ncbi:MAG: hypothetical protein HZA50_09150 [Planctomycetes bacterium]|nr:hypothetical protein [Planctomycetota bacterium]
MFEDTTRTLVFFVPIAAVVVGLLIWILAIRGTMVTRFGTKAALKEKDSALGDDDILIVFDWSGKVIYFPTIIASAVCALLMVLKEGGIMNWPDANTLGGCWLAVFFINFLMEEYDLTIKVLIIATLAILAVCLWLAFFGWLGSSAEYVCNHVKFGISSRGYLILGLIFALAIGISWLKGVFRYVVFTPNVMMVKAGVTEGSELIVREKYDIRVCTVDFMERLFGFGRIIITFTDTRRLPVTLLVWNINSKSRSLDHIRSIIAIDRPNHVADPEPAETGQTPSDKPS